MSRWLGLAMVAAAVLAAVPVGCVEDKEEPPAATRRPAVQPVPEKGPPLGKGQVRGRVVDNLADPVVGAEVAVAPILRLAQLRPPTPGPTHRTHTDAFGRFTLDLVPSTGLAVAVRHPYFQPLLSVAELRIDADTTMDMGDLVLEPAPGLVVEVTARESQTPLAGARVQLRPALEDATLPAVVLDMFRREARTAVNGHAPLYAVGPGPYVLRVEVAGHATMEIPHQQPATVTAALRIPVQLPKGTSLTGRVTHEGQPVAGARITCRASGGPLSPLSHVATSDARGDFRIDGLMSQPYLVMVTHPEQSPLVTTLAVGTHHVLELPKGLAVEGQVLDRISRQPVAGARVRARAASGWPAPAQERPIAITDANGRFRIGGLPAGIVSVAAESEGSFSGEHGPIRPGSGPLTLLLHAGSRATGKIQDPTGQPVSEALVQVIPRHEQPGPANQRLLASIAASETRLPHTTTGSSGRFDLGGLPPGHYRLLVHRHGLAPFVSKAFHLGPRGSEDLGTLELPAGGTIQGVARNRFGQPAAGATVCLDPLSGMPPETPGAQAVCDTRGRFALGPVAPGTYQMFYYSPGKESAAEAAATRHNTLVRIQVSDHQNLTQNLHPRSR